MAASGSHLRQGELWVRGQGLDSVPLPLGIHVPDAGRLNVGSGDRSSAEFTTQSPLSGCRGDCQLGAELGGMILLGRQKPQVGRTEQR